MHQRWTMFRRAAAAVLAVLFCAAPVALGQEPGAGGEPQATHHHEPRTGQEAGKMTHVHPPSPSKSKMLHLHHEMAETGRFGPYSPMRESSGTSWQPESSIHEGLHFASDKWTSMIHGWATAVWDDQGGPRGGDPKFFSSNMLMGRTHGPWGPGTAGLSAMLSAEPGTIGKEGYPLLLQTGETANGRTPLVDRQHPHDLFMELSASYALPAGPGGSLFVYGGLPGEPALGPPVFMHRMSGEWFPDAPISHHWLDSTHITYGVLTGGLVDGMWKFEGSLFRGREPDEKRTDIETGNLDSHSFRLSYNPSPNLAIQSSYGRLHSPEALEPDVDVDRTTASAMVAGGGEGKRREAMLAWGQNRNRPGAILDAFTLEAAAEVRPRHTVFARGEMAEKDELFAEGEPRHGNVYDVGVVEGGYRFDVWQSTHVTAGVGGLGTISFVPSSIQDAYGDHPASWMLFTHIALR
jgi:hypothetical protein